MWPSKSIFNVQQIDVNNTTLGDVVTRVIKAKLGFNEPSIMMGSCFLYEEGACALSYLWCSRISVLRVSIRRIRYC